MLIPFGAYAHHVKPTNTAGKCALATLTVPSMAGRPNHHKRYPSTAARLATYAFHRHLVSSCSQPGTALKPSLLASGFA